LSRCSDVPLPAPSFIACSSFLCPHEAESCAQVEGATRGLACFVRAALLKARHELMATRKPSSADGTSGSGDAAATAVGSAVDGCGGSVACASADKTTSKWMSDAEAWAAVRASGVPVLIVHGANDRIVPLSNSRSLLRSMPGARLLEFEDCGHCPQEETPERLADAIATFATSAGVLPRS